MSIITQTCQYLIVKVEITGKKKAALCKDAAVTIVQ
jgi:hypothetical protein